MAASEEGGGENKGGHPKHRGWRRRIMASGSRQDGGCEGCTRAPDVSSNLTGAEVGSSCVGAEGEGDRFGHRRRCRRCRNNRRRRRCNHHHQWYTRWGPGTGHRARRDVPTGDRRDSQFVEERAACRSRAHVGDDFSHREAWALCQMLVAGNSARGPTSPSCCSKAGA